MKRLIFFLPILFFFIACEKPETPDVSTDNVQIIVQPRNTITLRMGAYNPAKHDLYTGSWGLETGDIPYYTGITVKKEPTHSQSTCITSATIGTDTIAKQMVGDNCWVWSGDNGKNWDELDLYGFPDYAETGLLNGQEHVNAAGKVLNKIVNSNPLVKGAEMTFVGVSQTQHNIVSIHYWVKQGQDMAGVIEYQLPNNQAVSVFFE